MGRTFREAVETLVAETKDHDKSYFNLEHLTYWGCRLFDNEIEARKSFG